MSETMTQWQQRVLAQIVGRFCCTASMDAETQDGEETITVRRLHPSQIRDVSEWLECWAEDNPPPDPVSLRLVGAEVFLHPTLR